MLGGLWLDEDFRRRGPRVGLSLTLFIAMLLLLVIMIVWGARQS